MVNGISVDLRLSKKCITTPKFYLEKIVGSGDPDAPRAKHLINNIYESPQELDASAGFDISRFLLTSGNVNKGRLPFVFILIE